MESITKKRLIFTFYASSNGIDSRINNLHFRLLKRYINIFDEVLFCITIDDANNVDLIRNVENKIIDIYNGNITFKIYRNSEYRETLSFYNEIALKMSDLDGATFFAHNKGVSDTDPVNTVEEWIIAMYYFNLEFPLFLDMNGLLFYGALKCVDNTRLKEEFFRNRYNWFYCGTFFWGKYQEVKRVIELKHIEVPKLINRWYAELFPGELVSSAEGTCYGNIMLYNEPVYNGNIDWFLHSLYNNDTQYIYDNFINFYNEYKTNE